MISWIVATHDRDVLNANLLDSLGDLPEGEELVVVEDAPSIAAAYNEGTRRATGWIRVYVHHDVQVIDPAGLRRTLAEHCGLGAGIVGVIGSRTRALPWWEGRTLGAVHDARLGRLDFGPGGPAAYLDGLLLATVQPLTWDECYPGWHLYDHDICEQTLQQGLTNVVISGGDRLVRHNNLGHPTDVTALPGWAAGVTRFREKWRG